MDSLIPIFTTSVAAAWMPPTLLGHPTSEMVFWSSREDKTSDLAPRLETRLSCLCVPDGEPGRKKPGRLVLVPSVPVMVLPCGSSSFRMMVGLRAAQVTTEVSLITTVRTDGPVGAGAFFFVGPLAPPSGWVATKSTSSIAYAATESEVVGSSSRSPMPYGEKCMSNVALHEAFKVLHAHRGIVGSREG